MIGAILNKEIMKRYYHILKTDSFTEKPSYYIDGKIVQKTGTFNQKIINTVNKVVGKKQRNVSGYYDRKKNKFHVGIQI